MKLLNILCATLFPLMFSACGSVEEPHTKETFPVTGKITVDGQEPGSPIKITCHKLDEIDTEHPTISGSQTANDGTFEISTYTSGDGMPEGEYALTFLWGKMNMMSRSYGGPDKLKKRYTNPEKSEIKFTVEPGKPVDLGVIELTTK
ncbi:hypothetical protein [Gimesia sp.]|uniref:hypothetical protein n=1 Tax=Gimesia sp. TaxID=2024833 RepID=UPI000C4A0091|nr:hypothetical protein [Gimesia sp.]MAX40542.1 hypothetical protein [Gimesia sp.]HAH47385.1 hypothetical protein [Planctomycetaceae bacterium]HBL44324.1 hypothetical protein [Planctomycetaceae bacterium]|tara:strand:+ start:7655 stop:8095 length:441 start_codon:yes stop_codon:yes gene_type:complete